MNARPLRVYFACIGNSARSIMAEAMLRHLGGDRVEAHSGGSMPRGQIRGEAIAVLWERGIEDSELRSKKINPSTVAKCDYFVTMGCGEDACPTAQRTKILDWDLPDPAGSSIGTYRDVRNAIEDKVRDLLLSHGIPARDGIAHAEAVSIAA